MISSYFDQHLKRTAKQKERSERQLNERSETTEATKNKISSDKTKNGNSNNLRSSGALVNQESPVMKDDQFQHNEQRKRSITTEKENYLQVKETGRSSTNHQESFRRRRSLQKSDPADEKQDHGKESKDHIVSWKQKSLAKAKHQEIPQQNERDLTEVRPNQQLATNAEDDTWHEETMKKDEELPAKQRRLNRSERSEDITKREHRSSIIGQDGFENRQSFEMKETEEHRHSIAEREISRKPEGISENNQKHEKKEKKIEPTSQENFERRESLGKSKNNEGHKNETLVGREYSARSRSKPEYRNDHPSEEHKELPADNEHTHSSHNEQHESSDKSGTLNNNNISSVENKNVSVKMPSLDTSDNTENGMYQSNEQKQGSEEDQSLSDVQYGSVNSHIVVDLRNVSEESAQKELVSPENQKHKTLHTDSMKEHIEQSEDSGSINESPTADQETTSGPVFTTQTAEGSGAWTDNNLTNTTTPSNLNLDKDANDVLKTSPDPEEFQRQSDSSCLLSDSPSHESAANARIKSCTDDVQPQLAMQKCEGETEYTLQHTRVDTDAKCAVSAECTSDPEETSAPFPSRFSYTEPAEQSSPTTLNTPGSVETTQLPSNSSQASEALTPAQVSETTEVLLRRTPEISNEQLSAETASPSYERGSFAKTGPLSSNQQEPFSTSQTVAALQEGQTIPQSGPSALSQKSSFTTSTTESPVIPDATVDSTDQYFQAIPIADNCVDFPPPDQTVSVTHEKCIIPHSAQAVPLTPEDLPLTPDIIVSPPPAGTMDDQYAIRDQSLQLHSQQDLDEDLLSMQDFECPYQPIIKESWQCPTQENSSVRMSHESTLGRFESEFGSGRDLGDDSRTSSMSSLYSCISIWSADSLDNLYNNESESPCSGSDTTLVNVVYREGSIATKETKRAVEEDMGSCRTQHSQCSLPKNQKENFQIEDDDDEDEEERKDDYYDDDDDDAQRKSLWKTTQRVTTAKRKLGNMCCSGDTFCENCVCNSLLRTSGSELQMPVTKRVTTRRQPGAAQRRLVVDNAKRKCVSAEKRRTTVNQCRVERRLSRKQFKSINSLLDEDDEAMSNSSLKSIPTESSLRSFFSEDWSQDDQAFGFPPRCKRPDLEPVFPRPLLKPNRAEEEDEEQLFTSDEVGKTRWSVSKEQHFVPCEFSDYDLEKCQNFVELYDYDYGTMDSAYLSTKNYDCLYDYDSRMDFKHVLQSERIRNEMQSKISVQRMQYDQLTENFPKNNLNKQIPSDLCGEVGYDRVEVAEDAKFSMDECYIPTVSEQCLMGTLDLDCLCCMPDQGKFVSAFIGSCDSFETKDWAPTSLHPVRPASQLEKTRTAEESRARQPTSIQASVIQQLSDEKPAMEQMGQTNIKLTTPQLLPDTSAVQQYLPYERFDTQPAELPAAKQIGLPSELSSAQQLQPEMSSAQQLQPERLSVQQLPPERSPVQQLPPERSPVQQLPPEERSPVQQLPPERSPVQQLPPERSSVQQLPPERSPVQQLPPERSSVQMLPVITDSASRLVSPDGKQESIMEFPRDIKDRSDSLHPQMIPDQATKDLPQDVATVEDEIPEEAETDDSITSESSATTTTTTTTTTTASDVLIESELDLAVRKEMAKGGTKAERDNYEKMAKEQFDVPSHGRQGARSSFESFVPLGRRYTIIDPDIDKAALEAASIARRTSKYIDPSALRKPILDVERVIAEQNLVTFTVPQEPAPATAISADETTGDLTQIQFNRANLEKLDEVLMNPTEELLDTLQNFSQSYRFRETTDMYKILNQGRALAAALEDFFLQFPSEESVKFDVQELPEQLQFSSPLPESTRWSARVQQYGFSPSTKKRKQSRETSHTEMPTIGKDASHHRTRKQSTDKTTDEGAKASAAQHLADSKTSEIPMPLIPASSSGSKVKESRTTKSLWSSSSASKRRQSRAAVDDSSTKKVKRSSLANEIIPEAISTEPGKQSPAAPPLQSPQADLLRPQSQSMPQGSLADATESVNAGHADPNPFKIPKFGSSEPESHETAHNIAEGSPKTYFESKQPSSANGASQTGLTGSKQLVLTSGASKKRLSDSKQRVSFTDASQTRLPDSKQPASQKDLSDSKQPSSQKDLSDSKQPASQKDLSDSKQPASQKDLSDSKQPSSQKDLSDSKQPASQKDLSDSKQRVSFSDASQTRLSDSKQPMSFRDIRQSRLSDSKQSVLSGGSSQRRLTGSQQQRSSSDVSKIPLLDSKQPVLSKDGSQTPMPDSKQRVSVSDDNESYISDMQQQVLTSESSHRRLSDSKQSVSPKDFSQRSITDSKETTLSTESKQRRLSDSKQPNLSDDASQSHLSDSKQPVSSKESKQSHLSDSKQTVLSKELLSESSDSKQDLSDVVHQRRLSDSKSGSLSGEVTRSQKRQHVMPISPTFLPAGTRVFQLKRDSLNDTRLPDSQLAPKSGSQVLTSEGIISPNIGGQSGASIFKGKRDMKRSGSTFRPPDFFDHIDVDPAKPKSKYPRQSTTLLQKLKSEPIFPSNDSKSAATTLSIQPRTDGSVEEESSRKEEEEPSGASGKITSTERDPSSVVSLNRTGNASASAATGSPDSQSNVSALHENNNSNAAYQNAVKVTPASANRSVEFGRRTNSYDLKSNRSHSVFDGSRISATALTHQQSGPKVAALKSTLLETNKTYKTAKDLYSLGINPFRKLKDMSPDSNKIGFRSSDSQLASSKSVQTQHKLENKSLSRTGREKYVEIARHGGIRNPTSLLANHVHKAGKMPAHQGNFDFTSVRAEDKFAAANQSGRTGYTETGNGKAELKPSSTSRPVRSDHSHVHNVKQTVKLPLAKEKQLEKHNKPTNPAVPKQYFNWTFDPKLKPVDSKPSVYTYTARAISAEHGKKPWSIGRSVKSDLTNLSSSMAAVKNTVSSAQDSSKFKTLATTGLSSSRPKSKSDVGTAFIRLKQPEGSEKRRKYSSEQHRLSVPLTDLPRKRVAESFIFFPNCEQVQSGASGKAATRHRPSTCIFVSGTDFRSIYPVEEPEGSAFGSSNRPQENEPQKHIEEQSLLRPRSGGPVLQRRHRR